MATEAFSFGNPTTADQTDGGQVYTLGCEWESAAGGFVKGGRWRRPTNAPGVLCHMLLYRKSDQVLLASKTFTPSAGDNDVLFDSSVAVNSGTRYVTAVLTDRYAFSLGGWPYTTTNLTAPSGVNGRLATTTAGNPVYPATVHASAANFHIGPLFDAALTVSLTSAAATLTPIAPTATPGMVTVALTPAAPGVAAVALSATPGMVTASLTPATLSLSGVPVRDTTTGFWTTSTRTRFPAVATRTNFTDIGGG